MQANKLSLLSLFYKVERENKRYITTRKTLEEEEHTTQ